MRKVNLILLVGLFVWALTGCGGGGGGTGGGGPIVSDTTPPAISGVAVEPAFLVTLGTTVRVRANVTDDSSGVDAVALQVTYPDGSMETKPMALSSGSTYAVEFTASWGGNQPGTVRFVVSARDKAGNPQNAPVVEVRGAATPPSSPW